jgi:hypothetical protein
MINPETAVTTSGSSLQEVINQEFDNIFLQVLINLSTE